MTHNCVVCGTDMTLKPNGHGRCINCGAHVKTLNYRRDDDNMNIEKLTVLRMMATDFEELLEHADEVSAYNEEVQRGLRRKAYAEGFEEGRNQSDKQRLYKAMDYLKEVVEESEQERLDRIECEANRRYC